MKLFYLSCGVVEVVDEGALPFLWGCWGYGWRCITFLEGLWMKVHYHSCGVVRVVDEGALLSYGVVWAVGALPFLGDCWGCEWRCITFLEGLCRLWVRVHYLARRVVWVVGEGALPFLGDCVDWDNATFPVGLLGLWVRMHYLSCGVVWVIDYDPLCFLGKGLLQFLHVQLPVITLEITHCVLVKIKQTKAKLDSKEMHSKCY